MVNKRLAVEPGSHKMIEAMAREFSAGQGNRGVDQGCVPDWNACNDAGHVKKYSNHFVDCEND